MAIRVALPLGGDCATPSPTVAATALPDRTGQRFLFQPHNPEHMKDLIKPLEWQYYSDGECAYSEVGGGAITYRVFLTPECAYAKIDGDLIPSEFIDLDAAKASCQAHYNKMIIDGLSPEARAILEQHFNPTTPNT